MKTKINEIIKTKREKQGLSTRKLANLAECHHRTIQYYEKGDRAPTLETTDKILKALGVSLTIGKDGEL